MRKLALSLAVAGLIGVSGAVAEESGAFAGVNLGGKNPYKATGFGKRTIQEKDAESGYETQISLSGMGGYKWFFTDKFGIRAYGQLDLVYGKINAGSGVSYIFTANSDALFNFIEKDELLFGAFGGLGLGYAHYEFYPDTNAATGVDLNVNLGLRLIVSKKHSLEFYTGFELLDKESDEEKIQSYGATYNTNYKINNPYYTGFRYVYNF